MSRDLYLFLIYTSDRKMIISSNALTFYDDPIVFRKIKDKQDVFLTSTCRIHLMALIVFEDNIGITDLFRQRSPSNGSGRN